MATRFTITNRSESRHCCFTHSVVDTQTAAEGFEEDDTFEPKIMCETFSEEDAVMISNALNIGDRRCDGKMAFKPINSAPKNQEILLGYENGDISIGSLKYSEICNEWMFIQNKGVAKKKPIAWSECPVFNTKEFL